MGIRIPSITKKYGKHRYAVLNVFTLGYRETQEEAQRIRKQGYSVRVLEMRTGWVIYHYPQYPKPK